MIPLLYEMESEQANLQKQKGDLWLLQLDTEDCGEMRNDCEWVWGYFLG